MFTVVSIIIRCDERFESNKQKELHAKGEERLIQGLDKTHESEYNPSQKVHGGLSDTQLVSESVS